METMHDLVLVLPGIGGSSLYRGNEVLWDVSEGSLWPLFRDRKLLNDRLALPEQSNLVAPGEQVTARALIVGIQGIFGLGKVDGYASIKKILTENFEVKQGSLHAPRDDENFFEFPYDWRKSNAESASALKAFVDHQLPAWRTWSHWKNAKVILLAHSMGGLVSRYFLEVLGGWRQCRALITFGTPFRGSVDALEYLTNGYSKLDFDLSQALRSMPSVYELLPIYPVVKENNQWRRVAELKDLPATLCRKRVRAGLAFHRAIEREVRRHHRDAEYLKQSYHTFSVVGVQQPTLQSSEIRGDILASSLAAPPIVDFSVRGGDGRVPRVSATPIEQGHYFSALHFVECHSSLQSNRYVLDDLHARLQLLQVDPSRPAIRGHADTRPQSKIAIGLSVGDLYLEGDDIEFRAWLTCPSSCTPELHARVHSMNGTEVARCKFLVDADGHYVRLPMLSPGAYRVTVMAEMTVGAPSPVHDVFEIAPSSFGQPQ